MEPRTTSSTGACAAAGASVVAGDAGDQRLARRRAQAELVLAQGGQGRIEVGGELDVVEADDARRPRARAGRASAAARMAPMAIMSAAAKIAVGGSGERQQPGGASRPLSA